MKRDDLIHPFLNGNKARKLQYLIEKTYNEINHLISWGGAQSNAMYALSSLSSLKKWKFSYYTKNIDPAVKKNPGGNLKYALENGMELCEIEPGEFFETINALHVRHNTERCHIVPMGGQSELAQLGVKQLANELLYQSSNLKISSSNIFLSSGTGTTAAYLAKNMPDNQIYTVACVGNKEYLEKQIRQISSIPDNLHIMDSSIKIPFAKPHASLYDAYLELLQCGIEFDLIYDTHVWLWIKNNLDKIQNKPGIFIHSGGVHGNASQLQRYRRMGIV